MYSVYRITPSHSASILCMGLGKDLVDLDREGDTRHVKTRLREQCAMPAEGHCGLWMLYRAHKAGKGMYPSQIVSPPPSTPPTPNTFPTQSPSYTKYFSYTKLGKGNSLSERSFQDRNFNGTHLKTNYGCKSSTFRACDGKSAKQLSYT